MVNACKPRGRLRAAQGPPLLGGWQQMSRPALCCAVPLCPLLSFNVRFGLKSWLHGMVTEACELVWERMAMCGGAVTPFAEGGQ